MASLHLPGGGWILGLGEQVGDAVVAADPVEQHLPSLAETIRELLTVMRQNFGWNPIPPQRSGERQAHLPAGLRATTWQITQNRE